MTAGHDPDTCNQALSRVWAYLDGELSPGEAEEFEAHVRKCSRCHRAHDFERRLLDAVRRFERAADPDVSRLRERILAALRQTRQQPPG